MRKRKLIVFLGGTVAKNKWRPDFIRTALELGIDPETVLFVDPTVPVWDDAAMKREEISKRKATDFIFCLADPKQEDNPISVYSIHEAYWGCAEDPTRTVVVFDTRGMRGHALETMKILYDIFTTDFPQGAIFRTPEKALVWLLERANQEIEEEFILLDGTSGNNCWRRYFLEEIEKRGLSSTWFFNPVVVDWNKTAARTEEEARSKATMLFIYIGDPMQAGNPMSTVAVIQAQRALRRNPDNVILVIDAEGMSGHALKSMTQIRKELESRFRNAKIFSTLSEGIDSLVATVQDRSEKRATDTQIMMQIAAEYAEIQSTKSE